MTLRDEIAERMHAIRWAGRPSNISGLPERMWGDSTTEQHACLREADEVIRLMKWARRQGILWCEEQEDYSWGWPGDDDNEAVPLTLPPDDWKP
jgi:hypothetical protein